METYLAVVDGGIVTSAGLTSITVDGNTVEQLQLDKTNTILITTNLKTNTYGTPRVYYTTTSPSGYAECGNVVVASNAEGYMTIQCETTPTTVATGLTLHIVPKGTPSSTNPSDMTGDPFCSDGTYQVNTSECETGEWKWGSFTVTLPDIVKPVTPLMQMTYMQDMTPEGCAASSENDTKRLIDKRDGKYYWVAKLADGNCWMTQNLELDLVDGKELTPVDSDVSANWDPGTTTFTSGYDGDDSYDAVQSWSLGKAVWKTPGIHSYCSPNTNLYASSCANYWQNISDSNVWSPMTEYRDDGVVIEGNTYDAHYLAGNYYSYRAATAGTTSSNGGIASGSICPKGFTLPVSDGTMANGSFELLLSKIPTDADIAYAPLMFVQSGSVDTETPGEGLEYAGEGAAFWSSTYTSSRFANTLYIYSYGVEPGYGIAQFYGFSVRCVAVSSQS